MTRTAALGRADRTGRGQMTLSMMTTRRMVEEKRKLDMGMRDRAHKVIKLARAMMAKTSTGAPGGEVLRKASKPGMSLATNT